MIDHIRVSSHPLLPPLYGATPATPAGTGQDNLPLLLHDQKRAEEAARGLHACKLLCVVISRHQLFSHARHGHQKHENQPGSRTGPGDERGEECWEDAGDGSSRRRMRIAAISSRSDWVIYDEGRIGWRRGSAQPVDRSGTAPRVMTRQDLAGFDCGTQARTQHDVQEEAGAGQRGEPHGRWGCWEGRARNGESRK